MVVFDQDTPGLLWLAVSDALARAPVDDLRVRRGAPEDVGPSLHRVPQDQDDAVIGGRLPLDALPAWALP